MSDAFYLPEVADAHNWTAPVRADVSIEPYLDGKELFKAMGQDVAKARRFVYITGWAFWPSTKLVDSAAVRKLLAPFKGSMTTWADLLLEVARRGVTVRLLLSDFDPISRNHALMWEHYFDVIDRVAATKRGGLDESARGRFNVAVSGHPHAFSGRLYDTHIFFEVTSEMAIRKVIGAELAKLVTKTPGARRAWLRKRPGVLQYVAVIGPNDTLDWKASATWSVRPISHHQKTCVVDGDIAFIAGSDIAPLAVSECVKHNEPWHDVHARVTGSLARDVHRSFVDRWSTEHTTFNSMIGAVKTAAPNVGFNAARVTPITEAPADAPPASPGTQKGQFLRTASGPKAASQAPQVLVDDVERAYERAIGQAKNFIYIENQYLREIKVANWIVARAASEPQLVVLITVPVAPEEVRVADVDELTKYGMYLQRECMTKLVGALNKPGAPPRLGLYSLAQRRHAPSPLKDDTHGARQIYVHSKLMIVDDLFMLLGSANATPRSFRADTEAVLGTGDEPTVTAFRKRLWTQLLGTPAGFETWAPADYVKNWNSVAQANATQTNPRKRKGWVLPHDYTNPLIRGEIFYPTEDEWAVELTEVPPTSALA